MFIIYKALRLKEKFMAVKTMNYYGRISVSNKSIAEVAGFAALECYGVVDLAVKGKKLKKRNPRKIGAYKRSVKVTTLDNRIYIDISVILKYGVNITAVAESLRKSVKYAIEEWTGIIVQKVNINVAGIKA